MRPRPHAVLSWMWALMVLVPSMAAGHATGESYVWLNVETDRFTGRFELPIGDLRERGVPSLATADAGPALDQAVAAAGDEIRRYADRHFDLLLDGAELPLRFTGTEVVEVDDLGPFVHLFFETDPIAVPDRVEVRSTLLFEGDRFHRNLLCIEYDRRNDKQYGEEFTALVFGPSTSEQTLDLTDIEGLLRVRDFVWQGVLHIWIGIDHVLFLIALLLTAVLVRAPERRGLAPWQPVGSVRAAVWNIVKIVTTFTVAHSITLSLAALDVISLPSRLVESIIALSIVLVVLNNLWPRFDEGNWLLIFFFGLFHGMGFASVMGELPFRMMHLVQVILAFNIGVELGQLAIVAAAFPILYAVRRSSFYRPAVLIGGSVLIGLLAGYWFVERAFGL